MAQNLKNTIKRELENIKATNHSTEELLENRFQRLMSYGYC